jgi:general secretion pathway protein H
MQTSASEGLRRVKAHRNWRPSRGFSLFEMMIVLAVIASLSAVAATAFAPATGRAQLKLEAQEIAAIFSSARTRAITERTVTRISLDAAQQSIVAGSPQQIRRLPPSLTLGVASKDENQRRLSVSFFPDGGSSGADFALSGANQSVLFHVDWLTGRVSTTVQADVR